MNHGVRGYVASRWRKRAPSALAEFTRGRLCGLPILTIRHPSLDVLGTGGRWNAAEPTRSGDL
jgi:hypothetical protein